MRWLATLALLLLAAPAQARDPLPLVSHLRAWSGDYSDATEQKLLVARTEEGWAQLWAMTGEEPPMALPAHHMAVAVFIGEQPTGGHELAIDTVYESPSEVVVSFHHVAPPYGSIVVQTLTQPWFIRLAPLSTKPVRFSDGEAGARPIRTGPGQDRAAPPRRF